jgi:uncharacterized protein YndB with AHSA1/START domain
MASMERPVGLTRDAGWEIGVSRTLPYAHEAVWNYLISAARLGLWLGDGARLGAPGEEYATADGTTGELRSLRPMDRIRLTWLPRGWSRQSTVQVSVSPAGTRQEPKTILRFHQERLASAEEREGQRAHWTAVMDDVASALGRQTATRSAAT